jgi:hypothetical protein
MKMQKFHRSGIYFSTNSYHTTNEFAAELAALQQFCSKINFWLRTPFM